MKKVLIIKNIPMEGPGTIAEYLSSEGISYSVIEFSEGQRPESLEEFTHLVVMGGPMAVYEMDIHPWLKEEASLIAEFIKHNRAVLGVCLGAQMIAHVLGARVYPGKVKEIGWYIVDLTEEGLMDRAMRCLEFNGSTKAEVFQWHGDTFDLPEGAVRLASSEAYPNQAFRYKENIYALQFHIEVTPQMLQEWFKDKPTLMQQYIKQLTDAYTSRAFCFYREFFSW